MLDSKSNLAVRLKLYEDEGSSNCWDSLFQLQSCTSEVVFFFLNGETYLGPSCCRAIKTIEHQCWPAMLGSLGYTTEEGDILRGYCDASDYSPSTPPPPSATHRLPARGP
ncbi:Egg cell-secreted protein 1.1 [Abeliophyllum distichum]|uniref:Egg cell-secreted protein 1.1 n=1 Tax=Abeliophyllum distichum TaxID=126358 RepID=A0ABD1SD59_9LAMI